MMFVGEQRSELAKKRNVEWRDGKLAAKQLFDALLANEVDPSECEFVNWFETDNRKAVRNYKGTVFAMGKRVQNALSTEGIPHIPIVHPAARGRIRKKERYAEHIGEALSIAKGGKE